MILANYTQIHILLQITSIMLFSLGGAIFVIRLLLKKQIDYPAIGLSIALFIVELINNLNLRPFIYILIAVTFVYLLLDYIYYLFQNMVDSQISQTVLNQVKNDTADFYLCLNRKFKIRDYSRSFVTLTSFNKKEIAKLKTFDSLFKKLDIIEINDEYGIHSNIDLFINHLNEVTSVLKVYHFTLTVKLNNEHAYYDGIIQPIYLHKILIGYAMYLYKNKMQVVENIKQSLIDARTNILNLKMTLNHLMNMSEGIAMYFDYQERLYYCTDAFLRYTDSNKRTYSFQEFYDAIASEDKEQYNIQSELVNSIYVTRLKFKLKIKQTYFNAIEDSIYLSKDGCEFISIIHITSPSDQVIKDEVLSTKESIDLLNKLSEEAITPLVFRTEEILKKVLDNEE